MIEIRAARYPDDARAVEAIFREYIAARPSASNSRTTSRNRRTARQYAAPRGQLLLAWQGERAVGCAAFREIDATTCEMKRVYVRPDARGLNVGRRLVERLLHDAKAAGYARMCLDVLPESSLPGNCMRRSASRPRRRRVQPGAGHRVSGGICNIHAIGTSFDRTPRDARFPPAVRAPPLLAALSFMSAPATCRNRSRRSCRPATSRSSLMPGRISTTAAQLARRRIGRSIRASSRRRARC